MSSGLEDFSIFELFRMEAEEQVRVLQTELLAVENGDTSAARLEALMRAAHSLKGAARIVGLDPIVALTHSMEERLVAAQHGQALTQADLDRLLAAVDWLVRLQATEESETASWLEANTTAIVAFADTFTQEDVPAPAPILAEPPPKPHRDPLPHRSPRTRKRTTSTSTTTTPTSSASPRSATAARASEPCASAPIASTRFSPSLQKRSSPRTSTSNSSTSCTSRGSSCSKPFTS